MAFRASLFAVAASTVVCLLGCGDVSPPRERDGSASVTGVVVVEGERVAGAEVMVGRAEDASERTWDTVEARDGRFTLRPFREGEALSVRARLPDVGFSDVHDVVAPSSALAFAINPGGVLRGRVVDESGGPVEAFDVKATHFTKGKWHTDAGASADGTYVLGPLDAKSVALEFSSDGFATRRLSWQPLAEGRYTDVPDVALSQVLHLTGLVVDARTGQGVADASVWAGGETAYADAAGRFTVALGDTDMLIASARGYATQTLDAPRVAAGEPALEPFVIHLSHGGTVRGELMVRGAPASGSVSLFRADPPGPPVEVLQVEESEGGTFAFQDLLAGDYRVEGRTYGFLPRNVTVNVADGGETVVQIEVIKQNGDLRAIMGVVHGLVEGETAKVMIMPREDSEKIAAVSTMLGTEFRHTPNVRNPTVDVGDDSQFSFPAVPAGSYRVVLNTSRGREVGKWAMLLGGNTAAVEFVLEEGAIAGIVREAGGSGCDCLVKARPMDVGDASSSSRVSTKGTYRIEGLSTGGYAVQVLEVAPGVQIPVLHEVGEVAVDGEVVFDISLPASASLSGSIESPSGAIEGAAVTLSFVGDPDGVEHRTHSGHGGRFAFEALPQAKYVFRAFKSGYELVEYGMDLRNRPMVRQAVTLVEALGYPIQFVTDGEVLASVNLSIPGVRTSLELDEGGVGLVPSSLVGRDLEFGHHGYDSVTVKEWDGRRIVVELTSRTR